MADFDVTSIHIDLDMSLALDRLAFIVADAVSDISLSGYSTPPYIIPTYRWRNGDVAIRIDLRHTDTDIDIDTDMLVYKYSIEVSNNTDRWPETVPVDVFEDGELANRVAFINAVRDMFVTKINAAIRETDTDTVRAWFGCLGALAFDASINDSL